MSNIDTEAVESAEEATAKQVTIGDRDHPRVRGVYPVQAGAQASKTISN